MRRSYKSTNIDLNYIYWKEKYMNPIVQLQDYKALNSTYEIGKEGVLIGN